MKKEGEKERENYKTCIGAWAGGQVHGQAGRCMPWHLRTLHMSVTGALAGAHWPVGASVRWAR